MQQLDFYSPNPKLLAYLMVMVEYHICPDFSSKTSRNVSVLTRPPSASKWNVFFEQNPLFRTIISRPGTVTTPVQ